jgi:hypothetical protein
MKKGLLYTGGIVLLAVVMCIFAYRVLAPVHTTITQLNQEDSVVATTSSPVKSPASGEVAVKLGEWAMFNNLRIQPNVITEDSRCPVEVDCIQAGTVLVEALLVSEVGTSTHTFALGESYTFASLSVAFANVTPVANASRAIALDEYVLTFTVQNSKPAHAPVVPPSSSLETTQGACYVGGCSSQLCSDTPDMVSTCIYTEAYACYQTAVCERQQDGACGWTQTNALNTCLESSGSNSI